MCIPQRYHEGMSKQIAVRLPDDLVAFIDDLVSGGVVESRAALVKVALERERRRRLAEADMAILQRDESDGLEGFIEYTSRASLAELD